MPAAREASSPTALGLPCETFFLTPRPFALTKGRSPFKFLLTAPLAVAAGPRRQAALCHEQALHAEGIEQDAIVGDQQAHALETRESRRDCLDGSGINVLVGSSITSKSGRCQSAQATCSRFCWPQDKVS